MPRVPKLQRRKDRNLMFAEHKGKRIYFGEVSPETELKYHRWVAATFGTVEGEKTIANLSFDYEVHCSGHYADKSEREHIKQACVFLLPYAFEPCDSFGPRKLAAVRDAMRKRETWSDKYVNRQIARLRRMFRWGAAREYLTGGTLQALSALESLRVADKPPETTLTMDTLRKTLPMLTSVTRSMVMVQLLSACRPGEVCRMRPEQLDTAQQPWLWTVPVHKDAWRGKEKLLWIGPRAQHYLLPLIRRKPNDAIFSPAESENARGYRNKRASTEYTVAAYRQVIRRACISCGADHWRPYDIRHLAAQMTADQHGAEAVQARLDHDRLDTSRHYVSQRHDLARRLAEESG